LAEDASLHSIAQELLQQMIVVIAQGDNVAAVLTFQGTNLGVNDKEL